MIESAKFSHSKPENAEEDNVLFMMNNLNDEEDKFSDGTAVWYPV
jgi:hypothetical protein